jgi:hypothetical protein
LRTHLVAQLVGRGMGVLGNDTHDRKPLGSDLHAVLAEKLDRCVGHNSIQAPVLDCVNYWSLLISVSRS